MKFVKVGEAENHLSRYLRYVQAGERVRIMNRDVPVADLVPVAAETEAQSDEELLEALYRDGAARRPLSSGPLPKDFFEPGFPDASGRLLEALIDDRRRSRR